MSTLSSEVNDLFLTRIKDYRIDAIFNNSDALAFNTYLEPWLLDAIDEFDICDQDLSYAVSTDSVEGYFVETLNMSNKIMLSKLMVKYWMAKTINDILQMQNFVTDKDFKTFSSANNLKAKQEYFESKKEELSQELMDYAYKRNAWTDWKNQVFDS